MHFIIILCLFLAAPALAQDVPVPKSKKESVENLDARLRIYQSEQKKLEQEAAAMEADLGTTKSSLVKIAKSTQANERVLQVLESKISDLEVQKSQIERTLDKDRKAIAKLILALERIRRTPPEAMIARPDAPIDTARSAMLMGDILPVIHEKAEDLKARFQALDDIEDDLLEKKERALVASNDLKVEQKTLRQLLKKREKLYANVNSDIEDRQTKIAKISVQSKNLSDLVKRLEDERTRSQARAQARAVSRVAATAARVPRPLPLPEAGKAQLPLLGIVRTAYHEKDSFGAQSEGITIEGRSGALIVAPMAGVVRFSGFFKNYGNMVILEHQNGYHSLIAGLEKIDTVVDQRLSAGEPLGKLYKASGSKPSNLYYELRYKGKAVDPATKFAQLG